jgi:prepilin-type N-terminal cleavage/methylation domain-containing protein
VIRFFSLRSDKGLTLIETLAAITVFAIIMLGVTPLLAAALRGAGLSRSYTFSKNLTQEAMERVRGLPYFTTATNRDVLDLYFPNRLTGYNGATSAFTTTCTKTTSTPAASGAIGCPQSATGTSPIPAGHTMTYRAEFVTPAVSGATEVYNAVPPGSTYDSSTADSTAPSNLLRMTITLSWTYGGKPASFKLTTLLGQRRQSIDKFNAEANVDFTINTLSSYKDATDRLSSLAAVLGRSQSTIELADFAGAKSDVSTGKLTLTRAEVDGVPGETLVDAAGAQATMTAPPNVAPAATTAGSVTVVHPDLVSGEGNIAYLRDTSVNTTSTTPPGVSTTNELPRSVTNFTAPFGTAEQFWMSNQADDDASGLLKFDPSGHMLSVFGHATAGLGGSTYAEATPVDTGRKVESRANAAFSKMVLLPTSFIPGDKGVVVVEDFVANVNCKSTGQLGGAVATGTWSAKLKVWLDSNPSDGIASGSYVPIPLSGSTTSTATDPLATYSLANNPMVLDSAVPGEQVYLFDDPAKGRVGYLESWSSSPLVSASADATTSTVAMNVALSIATAQTDPANDATKLAVNVGQMSCEAVDARG